MKNSPIQIILAGIKAIQARRIDFCNPQTRSAKETQKTLTGSWLAPNIDQRPALAAIGKGHKGTSCELHS